MTNRRLAKAAEAIRETVSTTILFELRDPRVKNITILGAEAAPDLRTAKVYVSVMGTAKQQSLCLHGLESARGFIQAKLADRLQTKYTPVLTFILDPAVKKSIETSRLLREVIPSEGDATTDADETDANEVDEVETNALKEDVPAQGEDPVGSDDLVAGDEVLMDEGNDTDRGEIKSGTHTDERPDPEKQMT